jgi:hypothetical protein
MAPSIPLSTHLFLLAVPLAVGLICIAVFLKGGRHGQ